MDIKLELHLTSMADIATFAGIAGGYLKTCKADAPLVETFTDVVLQLKKGLPKKEYQDIEDVVAMVVGDPEIMDELLERIRRKIDK